MVIVKIWAGLGNQMFQYALYRQLQVMKRDVKLDTSYYTQYNAHNGYELSRVFNISECYATEEESKRFAAINLNFFSRAFRKLIYTKKTHYVQHILNGFGFDEKVLRLDNVYLQGYWQSEKYFENAKYQVRKDFEFKMPLDKRNSEIANHIMKTLSVSIHVRRGDYLKSKNLGGICSSNYYQKALERVEKQMRNPYFFIFSDDINWCKENIKVLNGFYIDWNIGLDSYKDMHLMSLCKHNIIANSSFSWWGAWLNNNPDKLVIAPDRWFGNKKTNIRDITPDAWVRISTGG